MPKRTGRSPPGGNSFVNLCTLPYNSPNQTKQVMRQGGMGKLGAGFTAETDGTFQSS